MSISNEFKELGNSRFEETKKAIKAMRNEELLRLDAESKIESFLRLSSIKALEFTPESQYEVSVSGGKNKVSLARQLVMNSSIDYLSSVGRLLEVPESFNCGVFSGTQSMVYISGIAGTSYSLAVEVEGQTKDDVFKGQQVLVGFVEKFNQFADRSNSSIVSQLRQQLDKRIKFANEQRQGRLAVVEELKQTGFVVKEYN